MITLPDFLDSIEFVAKNSDYVSINEEAIDRFTKGYVSKEQTHWTDLYPLEYKSDRSSRDELMFALLIGSQAFYFWGFPQKWTIQYKGKTLDGWWALIACFERALEKKLPILDSGFLRSMTGHDAKVFFEGTPEIPFPEERVKIFNDIGTKLQTTYHGSFSHAFRKPMEAFLLLDILSAFHGFDDVALYKGRKIYFYKKAQVVASDIHYLLRNTQYGDIENYDQLPGHADYKIPAIMRSMGILDYSKELAALVDTRKYLLPGSAMEVEIRANMLWATQLMCRRLKEKNISMSPTAMNGMLWNESQKQGSLKYPYHLTQTIYY